jgi:hypothetical protein
MVFHRTPVCLGQPMVNVWCCCTSMMSRVWVPKITFMMRCFMHWTPSIAFHATSWPRQKMSLRFWWQKYGNHKWTKTCLNMFKHV